MKNEIVLYTLFGKLDKADMYRRQELLAAID